MTIIQPDDYLNLSGQLARKPSKYYYF